MESIQEETIEELNVSRVSMSQNVRLDDFEHMQEEPQQQQAHHDDGANIIPNHSTQESFNEAVGEDAMNTSIDVGREDAHAETPLDEAKQADLEDDEIFDERLRKIKTAIDKATQEALPAGTANLYKERSIHKDNNVSFMLGMELFGQEPSMVERNIRESLSQVERDLDKVLREDDETKASDFEDRPPSLTQDNEAASSEELREKAEFLSQRIAFLKACSMARSHLDESKTLSNAALARNATHLTADGEPNIPEAAECWLKAFQQLQDAKQKMDDVATDQQHIFRSLQSDIRSQRVELVHFAKTTLNSSITVESNEISVKSSDSMEESYQVLETLQGHGGQDALREFIRQITQRLIKTIVHPLVASHKELTIPLSSTAFQIMESTDRATRSLLGSTAANALAKSKGIMHRLEWTRDDKAADSQAAFSDQSGNHASIAAWKPTLELMSRIVSFVHQQILLQRPMLCELVGPRWFGKPQALPSPMRLELLAIDSETFGYDNGLWMEPLVRGIVETTLPNFVLASELDKLDDMGRQLESCCKPFIDKLQDIGLLPKDDAEHPSKKKPHRLIQICREYTHYYIQNRREHLLFEARELIQKSDYHNTISVGNNPATHPETQPPEGVKGTPFEAMGNGMSIFLLHKASVSQIAHDLLQKVHTTMQEAVSIAQALKNRKKALHTGTLTKTKSDFPEPPAEIPAIPWDGLPAELYQTARQYLFLFRCIIPSKYSNEISKVPRTAAVLHNDCVFFNHHCLTIGLQYKDDLGPPKEDMDAGISNTGKLVPQLCMFVDMVPLFRELADKSMGEMIEIQKQQIIDLVVPRIGYLAQSLSSSEPVQEWSDAETAVDAALYHFQHLQQTWNPPMLSTSIFGRSMGFLADVLMTIFSHHVVGANISGGIIPAKSITPRACHFLSSLFDKIRQGLIKMFEKASSSEQLLSTCSSEWSRFTAWAKVWESSLADIESALSQGIFRDVLGPELAGLIRAMFSDTPRRQKLLKAILKN